MLYERRRVKMSRIKMKIISEVLILELNSCQTFLHSDFSLVIIVSKPAFLVLAIATT